MIATMGHGIIAMCPSLMLQSQGAAPAVATLFNDPQSGSPEGAVAIHGGPGGAA